MLPWTPEYVSAPESNPKGRTYFNWNDERLQRWKDDAIKMQDAHVKDNNRTEWFAYERADGGDLELRIAVTVYGVRTPEVSLISIH